MASFLPDVAEPKHVKIFAALADGILHDTSPALIKEVVGDHLTEEECEEYAETFSRPSEIPEFEE